MNVPVLLLVEDDITLLLAVPAGDLHRDHQPVAAAAERGIERRAQAGAHAGAPEDSAVLQLRGSRARGVEVSRVPAGRDLRCGVSARRRADSAKPASNWRAWCARPCPTFPSCCNPAAPSSWSAAHQEGFSFLQKRSPTLLGDLRKHSDGGDGLRRFRLSSARRQDRGGARGRPECAGDACCAPFRKRAWPITASAITSRTG